MLKTCCVFLLLLVSTVTALAQAQGKLAKLNSDAAVQQVVRSLDDYYKNFKVDSRLRFEDKRVQKIYQREKTKAWEKADVDGNGLIDLLITGTHYDDESKVICVLDMGDSLVLEDFGRQFYRYCPVARIVY
jgi:spermidine/putrescine-binding protein